MTSHGARVWLTRYQIARIYNSEEVANEICEAKLADPELKETHTKLHRDCPHLEARKFLFVLGVGTIVLVSVHFD